MTQDLIELAPRAKRDEYEGIPWGGNRSRTQGMCGECIHFEECRVIKGVKAGDIWCAWNPSVRRFESKRKRIQ
jgi:hypothetical protein